MIDLALDNQIIIDSEVEAYIQEIDLLFNTENTELLGDTDYGTNFEYFLYELKPNTEEIRTYISQKLSTTYFGQFFNTEVNVEIINGTVDNIYLIQLVIYIEGEIPIKKTYIYR